MDAPATVREGSLAEAWAIYEKLPEFTGGLLKQNEFEHRLNHASAIVLIAERDGTPLGLRWVLIATPMVRSIAG